MSPIRFEVVSDSAGLRDLETDWRALFSRIDGATIFQTFDWHWHTWETSCASSGRGLHILVGRIGATVSLIWPLMRDDAYLTFLTPGGFQYNDALLAPGPEGDALLSAAWRTVSRQGADLLLLLGLRPNSRLVALLTGHQPAARHRETPSHSLQLSAFPSWAGYLASLPKRLMADQARQWRRLERLPDGVAFELAADPAAVKDAIGWLLDRKMEWLTAKAMPTSLIASPEYRAFLEAISTAALARGWLFLASLRSGPHLLSVLLGFRVGTQLSFYNFAYDHAWNPYSPGRLLLERSIRWCWDNDVQVFDFLTGGHAYKETWANQCTTLSDFTVPLSLKGRAILSWHSLKLGRLAEHPLFRTAYLSIPPGLRGKLRRALQTNAMIVQSMDEPQG